MCWQTCWSHGLSCEFEVKGQAVGDDPSVRPSPCRTNTDNDLPNSPQLVTFFTTCLPSGTRVRLCETLLRLSDGVRRASLPWPLLSAFVLRGSLQPYCLIANRDNGTQGCIEASTPLGLCVGIA